jgi:hypothetical protein
MAQKLNKLDNPNDPAMMAKNRRELMKDSLRRAKETRKSLEGRKHSDSTALIAEDRKR